MKFTQSACFSWAVLSSTTTAFQQSQSRQLQIRQPGGFISTASKNPTSQRHVQEEHGRPASQLRVARVTPSDLSNAPPFDEEEDTEGELNKATIALPKDPVSKFRKLKDVMWARETVEDITAAEFACSVEASVGEEDESLRRQRKRAVDYEKMLTNLNRRISDMTCVPFDLVDTSSTELDETTGMGRFTFTSDERKELLS